MFEFRMSGDFVRTDEKGNRHSSGLSNRSEIQVIVAVSIVECQHHGGTSHASSCGHPLDGLAQGNDVVMLLQKFDVLQIPMSGDS